MVAGGSGSDLGSDNGGLAAADVQSNMSNSSKRMTRKERMERRMSMSSNIAKSNEENRLPTAGATA